MSHYNKKSKGLILLIVLAFILRLYGINWDQGFHLHPDERMLIMVTDRIHFFNRLNPNFFNYGSLPIYILKGTSQLIDWLFKTNIANYQGMLFVGRSLSSIADVGTIIVIYKLAEILFPSIGLLAAFFYTIAFFPIQNSHFFIVDTFLTFFSTLLIYLLIRIIKDKHRHLDNKKIILLGIVSAAIVAIKISGIIFVAITGLALLVLILKKEKKERFKAVFAKMGVFSLSWLAFSFIFMPYAFLNYHRFISDISAQIKMNSNPYIFPYTLQYVGSLPYLYPLKNIFFWGLGPVVSLLSLAGVVFFIKNLKLKIENYKNKLLFFIFVAYYLVYFLIIGRSAVKFMRYMLPIYPFLVILAGYGLHKIRNTKYKILNTKYEILNTRYEILNTSFLIIGLIFLSALWTVMFLNIYRHPTTRVTATRWINKNIPPDSTLAIEHWDDRLPLYGGEKYRFTELPLYNQFDDGVKWRSINEKLATTDYIIIASNRLYVPLQKLNNCRQYKICYPKTADYYRRLFRGEILQTPYGPVHFQKVAQFAVYPELKIGNWRLRINDQGADESFTVYDHPKIMIFRRDQ